MRKTRQVRPDQPREPVEDDINREEDDASLADTGAAIASSGLSTEALLKHISETVAGEAKRTQTVMNEAFARLESTLDTKIDTLIKRIDDVAAVSSAHASRLAEAETRISGLEDSMTPLGRKVAEMAKVNAELMAKITDIESRSRRDNIRILNLRESTEGRDPVAFFEKFLPQLLKLPVADIPIDRAHRGFGVPTDGRPRPIIIKLHRSRDVSSILSAVRRMDNLQHEGRSLRIVPDIPPSVRVARRAFNGICTDLIKNNIRFRMLFPAVLSFEISGVRKSFNDPKDAQAFLDKSITSSPG